MSDAVQDILEETAHDLRVILNKLSRYLEPQRRETAVDLAEVLARIGDRSEPVDCNPACPNGRMLNCTTCPNLLICDYGFEETKGGRSCYTTS